MPSVQQSKKKNTSDEPSQQKENGESQQEDKMWTHDETMTMLERLRVFRENHGAPILTWQNAHFNACKEILEQKYPSFSRTAKAIRGKFEQLVKTHKAIKTVLDLSGFGWNHETQCPTADDSVWKTLKRQQQAFRYKPFVYKDILDDIREGCVGAMGEGVVDVLAQINMLDEEEEGVGEGSTTLENSAETFHEEIEGHGNNLPWESNQSESEEESNDISETQGSSSKSKERAQTSGPTLSLSTPLAVGSHGTSASSARKAPSSAPKKRPASTQARKASRDKKQKKQAEEKTDKEEVRDLVAALMRKESTAESANRILQENSSAVFEYLNTEVEQGRITPVQCAVLFTSAQGSASDWNSLNVAAKYSGMATTSIMLQVLVDKYCPLPQQRPPYQPTTSTPSHPLLSTPSHSYVRSSDESTSYSHHRHGPPHFSSPLPPHTTTPASEQSSLHFSPADRI